MNSKQILFFTSVSDIKPIIQSLESTYSIQYYETGLFDTKSYHAFSSVSAIPDLGTSKHGDWNRDLKLMVIPQDATLVIREVPQRSGAVKYAIDPLENQTSVCIQFGGVYKEGILIAGSFGTAFLNEFSLEIFKTFSSKIRKEFKRIGAFYVSRDAQEQLWQGWRLVTNEQSPKEYDLSW